jgi:hypothetical protein
MMTDEIIDLTRYLRREPEGELPRGAMSLWGAEGERSRFALPLWRIVYLAGADRGLIAYRTTDGSTDPVPFVALDLAREPARTSIPADVPTFSDENQSSLVDRGAGGVFVFLGRRAGREWKLVVDGGSRSEPLGARAREDILFLAGECAGLLVQRELGDVSGEAPDVPMDDE